MSLPRTTIKRYIVEYAEGPVEIDAYTAEDAVYQASFGTDRKALSVRPMAPKGPGRPRKLTMPVPLPVQSPPPPEPVAELAPMPADLAVEEEDPDGY